MSEHTPGPWKVGTMTETELPGVMQLDGPIIAEITKWTSVGRSDPDVIQGNARLIAKAPELLEALDFAYHLRFVDDSNTHEEQMTYWKNVERLIGDE